MYDLKGKVAVVTGAGRPHGIGRAIALRLAQEGANVAVADICQEFGEFPDYGLGQREGLNAVAEEVTATGAKGLAVKVDVSDEGSVEEMIQRTVDEFGRVDIMVNNAGGAPGPAPLVQMTEAAWSKTLAINATGAFLCSKSAAQRMVAQGDGGKIITISSQAGKTGGSPLGAYTAAKAAIIGFTRVLAMELAPNRINVNAVCPGVVDTDLMRWGWKMMSEMMGVSVEEIKKQSAEQIPLGRLEEPSDVANLVAFLASRESDYMTGQSINVTGGMEMH